MDLIQLLRDPAPFMPHGMCLLWDPALIWLHLGSDLLTAFAYYSIPVALFVFARRRKDLAYKWIFIMFGLFIAACGTTHVYGAWTLWQPDYVAEGLVKAMTAAVSLATAAALWPLIPRALLLPSPSQLHEANLALNAEVAERIRAEAAVREANADLERRVRERTAELERMNATLESRVRERTAELESALRRLRESEARYAGIVNNAADGIFLLDVGPGGDARVVSTNPALAAGTGLAAADIQGRRVEEAFDPAVAAELGRRIGDCLSNRAPVSFELETDHQRRRRIFQLVLAPVLSPDGAEGVQIVGAARNVTEFRDLQDELAQTAKLATLGTMAAGVAHEMSQPLNAIRITAADCALLLEEEEAPDRTYLAEGMVTIRDQAARMGGIVDQLRLFGRRAPDEHGAFDPAEPLRRAVDLIARHYAAQDIAVDLDLPAPLPPVTGQPARLEQVILNLLSNARDAIEEARAARPDAPGRITLRADAEGGMVRVTVEDTGIGLTAETAARMFDPFFTTKHGQKGMGMGLGLSISASLIAAMGGRIEAEPAAEGARFHILLPIRRGEHR